MGGWQEAYMDKLNRSYIDLLSEDKEASEKFWNLSKKITEDKKRVGVQLEMSRSKLIMNIVSLIMDEVISFEDLEEFSDELQETIKQILSIRKSSS
ncbi:MAG: multidrug transporter [Tetragenococcus halophilus]|nr:multidrug transporter [Tetragenococcus halophilus]MDN6204470.1 multidrug transporter [Tetragenococcus halophilus]MDN6504650.1 multidrug transporter [Tetragenococcus halophilus]MDN6568815.1 multidrug transporter [Tetragenococcus halophilus]MDN6711218.1 multidrug transporter [Tetragenococcus halophilus]